MTPCDRLLASDAVSAWKKAHLRATYKALNPFDLNRGSAEAGAAFGGCGSRWEMCWVGWLRA